jgi:hypothetical protein
MHGTVKRRRRLSQELRLLIATYFLGGVVFMLKNADVRVDTVRKLLEFAKAMQDE